MTKEPVKKQRQRAPSQRSLETRKRILDAAEQVFADRGYEGASIRDIARAASQLGPPVQGALVNHHGGSKEELFVTVVSRRADELAQARFEALTHKKATAAPSLRDVLACFIQPFTDRFLQGGPEWAAYGRLIAYVSSDARWRHISETCFDPTAKIFIDEISRVLPDVCAQRISAHFVFMVSSMLSICTSRWRIDALSASENGLDLTEALLDFCEAGFKSSPAHFNISG